MATALDGVSLGWRLDGTLRTDNQRGAEVWRRMAAANQRLTYHASISVSLEMVHATYATWQQKH